MKPRKYSRLLLNSPALTAVIVAWAASSAQAANKAWSTTPANGNFSETNWTVGIAGTTPPTDAAASLDALFFDTSTTTTLNNDLVGATFAGLTFNSGSSAFTIGGTAFTLSAAIANNSSSLQTINNNITLAATQTVTTNTGGVTLGGALSGAGGLTKTGTGTLALSAANSFTGALTVQAGTTNITANTTNIGTGQVFVGNVASTAARLNLSGNSTLTTSTTAFTNYVGGATSAVGVINIASGSTFSATATTTTAGGNIGGSTNSAGAIYNAGTLTQNAQAAAGAGFFLGNAGNAYGYLRSSGAANISARVGLGQTTGGAGVVDINGGITTVGGTNQTTANTAIQINSGNTGSGSVSALNVTNGGSLLVTKAGNQTYRVNNGSNQYASINIDGVGSVYNTASGLVAANALSGIDLGQASQATNTTTLTVSNSGVLATNYVFKAGALATGILNFNGGTLRPTGTSDVNGLIQTSIATVIHSNGATVDTNGNSATINGVLAAPTGNGVASVTLGGTLTGYVGAPVVKFSGGSGTGAAGYATFDPATGTITGIAITSPGSGYTTAPTVTLLGGSGTVATGAGAGAATAAASIGAVTGGSLTKTGSGTLTLAAVNTYTGATNVTGGTLTLNATGSVNNSSGIVVNGSGAKFLQTSATAPTPAVTVTQGTVDGTGNLGSVTFESSPANILTHGDGGTATLTINNLTFNDAATINLNAPSTTFPKIATTTLTTGAANGTGKVTINASNAIWAPGEYQLIGYTTLGGIGFSEFQKGTITGLSGRQSATLTDSPGVIALTIAGDNPVWAGALNGDWTTATLADPKNWALITSMTPTDYINGDIVVFDDSATTSTVNISSADVSPLTTTFDNSGVEIGGLDYEIGGAFGIAAGSVILNGFGPVTLSTANTYPGGTTVNKGTLKINNSSAIGTGTLTIAGTGSSRIDTAGSAITLATNNAQNWNSDFTFVGSNDLNLGTGAVTISGNRSVTTEGSATLTVGGSIGGGFSLTKAGAGTLALTGTSSIGNLKVSAGLLKISAGTLNVAENSGNNTQLSTGGNIEVSGGAVNISGVGGWFPIGDTNGQTSTFTVSGGTVSVANNFGTEVGRLGAGVLTIISGSYSTTDTAGIGLIVGDNQTGAAGVGTINLNGGFLAANKITSITPNANKFYLNGGVLKPISTNATWFPNTTNLSTEVRNGGAIIDTNGFDVTIDEILAHSAFGGDSATDGGLTKSGLGTLILSGANTYTGSTTVNGGTLSLATAYLSDSAAVVVGANGVLNLTHNSTDQVGSLTINGVLKPSGVYDSTNSGGFITGTGKLQVGTSGYGTWAATNAGGQTPDLDFDNDGVKNGVEYFMGQTGSTFTANPGIVSGKVTWPKDPAFSGTFKVETSSDLAVWSDVTATPAVDTTDPASVKYTVPTGSGKLFIRLDVTPN